MMAADLSDVPPEHDLDPSRAPSAGWPTGEETA
jgi:hypothetical protein